MADTWSNIYKGELEGREIEIDIYDEGGYRVKTTQKENDPGDVVVDEESTTIMPPTESGIEIHIEGESKEDLIKEMTNAGFTEAGARGVVENL